uniref:Uncharacterized protein n=1 Tax=viral metagenome TaxID=1070528 RepID=A0A6C0I9I8_9ZZZZ
MAKSRKNRASSKKRQGQRGGNAFVSSNEAVTSSDTNSAWGWVTKNFGDLQTQITNSLVVNPAQGPVAAANTASVPIGNPNANTPNVYKGGKRGSRRRGRKGGIIGVGAVLEQAIVPLGLFALQNTYSKRKGNNNKSKHHRK